MEGWVDCTPKIAVVLSGMHLHSLCPGQISSPRKPLYTPSLPLHFHVPEKKPLRCQLNHHEPLSAMLCTWDALMRLESSEVKTLRHVSVPFCSFWESPVYAAVHWLCESLRNCLKIFKQKQPRQLEDGETWKDSFPEAISILTWKEKEVFHVPASEEMLPSFLFLNPPLLPPSSSMIPGTTVGVCWMHQCEE